MRRREFLGVLGGAAAFAPVASRAQQPKMPVIALINGNSADASTRNAAAFRNGLKESGYIADQNVTVEYHWLEGRYDRLPALLSDLVRRRVAVIATPGSSQASVAAKSVTGTIPIIFGVGSDPVKLGLVASLAQPRGNASGVNFFAQGAISKRFALMHELSPRADRVAVLVNPANRPGSTAALSEVKNAAAFLGLQVHVVKASTQAEINAAFATFKSEGVGALFIAGDGFFGSRSGQFVTLSLRDRMPASYSAREMVEAGLLMSYGANVAVMYRQVGIYVGRILDGAKPAELPVVQSRKFELVINRNTATALGLDIPPNLLAIADEVIG